MAVLPFEGIYVPPVTPFKGGAVDEASLRKLTDHLIDGGATGLVPCGTTGESPTLSHDEHLDVVRVVIEQTAGRVPVIAGAGSNSTTEAISLAKGAEELGADALLMVSPYYNRPSQEGILAHFAEIAKNTSLPIVIYNIPFRTGRNVDPPTIVELSKLANFRALKQSTGEIAEAQAVIRGAKDFSVLTGDDELLLVLSCLGGKGAILASGHFATDRFLALYEHVKAGRIAEARALHYDLLGLVKACFCEPNPAPIKTGLKLQGIIESDEVRLPMTPATPDCSARMKGELERLGLL
jgi:4-hydroxy-tetrahydrodipicolinate synthase